MKKIVSVLTVAALTLGTSFADISLTYTQKALLSNDDGSKSTYMDLNGYNTKVSDNVVFQLKNDMSGVYLKVKPTDDSGSQTLTFNNYYGWFKLGDFKVMSGICETRSIDRVTKDAGKWEGAEYEKYKPGVNSTKKTWGNDVANQAYDGLNGKLRQATSVSYSKNGFTITGLLVDCAATTGYGAYDSKSYPVIDATYKGDAGTFTFIYKNPTVTEKAYGVFVSPTISDKLSVMFGGTFVTAATDAYAFDLRARYVVNDTLAVTTMNNYSSIDGQKAILWDMFSAAIKVNAQTTATATLSVENTDLGDYGIENGIVFEFVPGISYTPCKGANITSGLIVNVTRGTTSDANIVKVPLVLSFSL